MANPVAQRARALHDGLPPQVREAVADLHPEAARRDEWALRYLLSCPRRRRLMVYLALRDAGS